MVGLTLVCVHPAVTAALLLAMAEARQEQLFRAWDKAKADTRSLVVEFTLETASRVRDEKEQFDGTCKLLRTPRGEVLALYTLAKREKAGGHARTPWVGLLNRGALYVLCPGEKRAQRYGPEDGKLRLWLEEKFNPFALLLDEKHARAGYHLQVTSQDENYTYLEVKPKPRKSAGSWFELRIVMERGRAVFMNKDAGGVPKDMPRQLWYECPAGHSYTFDIRRWKANAADGPKVEEFTRPEDRPGWQVE